MVYRMMTPEELAERDRCLIEMDVAGARKQLGSDAVHFTEMGMRVGMHKARINLDHLPLHLRQESLQFLRDGGYSNLNGGPLPERIEK